MGSLVGEEGQLDTGDSSSLLKDSPKHKRQKVSALRRSGRDKQKRSLAKSKGNKNNAVKMAENSSMLNVPDLKDIENVPNLEEIETDDEDRRALAIGDDSCAGSSSVTRFEFRKTQNMFQRLVNMYQQREEKKSKGKRKKKDGKRADIEVSNILKAKGRYINREKVIGAVPGIEIGDIFRFRLQLAALGVHSQPQGGIDTLKQGNRYVAISVVASGGYDNDVEGSDVLIYTGQGGNPTGPDMEPEDQKLVRGNLALRNCVDERTPVRVIRGFKEKPPIGTTYTYDGLYTVERYWQDAGPHGKLVYKFELSRIPGQREVAWKEVVKHQSSKSKVREGCCVDDISDGKEKPPICAVNTIDDEKPAEFTYITRMMYPADLSSTPLVSCDCKNGCSDSQRCACVDINEGEIPYNLSGLIVRDKPLVYECGPACKCPPSCSNRVSQHGIKLPLELFKTASTGWGVRCLCSIPSGSFICEYVGELLDDKQAEQRTGYDEYLFDIGKNYSTYSADDLLEFMPKNYVMPSVPAKSEDRDGEGDDTGFTIDAFKYGNIARFINHSCSPNLYAQNVVYDHGDKKIPHIMLFATDNIPPLQELSYHYNYKVDEVRDPNGNVKTKNCYCGSFECTGRMY